MRFVVARGAPILWTLSLAFGGCAGDAGRPESLQECLADASQRADSLGMQAAAELCRQAFAGAGRTLGGGPPSPVRPPSASPGAPPPGAMPAPPPAEVLATHAPRAGFPAPMCKEQSFGASCGAQRVDGGGKGFVLYERCLCVADLPRAWDCIGLEQLRVVRYHATADACAAAAGPRAPAPERPDP